MRVPVALLGDRKESVIREVGRLLEQQGQFRVIWVALPQSDDEWSALPRVPLLVAHGECFDAGPPGVAVKALQAVVAGGTGSGGIILLADSSFPPRTAECLADAGVCVHYREEPAAVLSQPDGHFVEEVLERAHFVMLRLMDQVWG